MSKVLTLSALVLPLGLIVPSTTTAESSSGNVQIKNEQANMTTEARKDLLPLSLSHDFITQAKKSYDYVHTADLNGDGEWEVISSLNEGGRQHLL